VTERYSIISGTGSVEVGNLAPQTVSTGDVIIIPPMCRQRIRNTGAENRGGPRNLYSGLSGKPVNPSGTIAL